MEKFLNTSPVTSATGNFESPEIAVEETPELSAGERKVNEYVERVLGGEPLDTILNGLPESFAHAITKKFLGDIDTPDHIINELHERGLIDSLLSEVERMEEREGVQPTTAEVLPTIEAESIVLATEAEKERLTGWAAGYELARVAMSEGVDLTTLSREEYVEYAVEHNLQIDDGQLRAARWERMMTSPEEIVARRKEMMAEIPPEQIEAFSRFDTDMRSLAATDNRFIRDGVRVRQGTKDSNSWLFFGINESFTSHPAETHKGYVTFKDLGQFTPDIFVGYMEALQQAGYNGDVKVFQDMGNQALLLNDQVVMHGATQEDVALASEIARNFFGENLAEVAIGMDVKVNGESKSYSQVLAEQIKNRIGQRRMAA